jgi:hypothetical protein
MARGAPKHDRKAEPDALASRTVASVPRVVTPESPVRGTWDAFKVLRDPGAPAACERGELDSVLMELHEYVVRHGSDALRLSVEARAVSLGIQLQGVPALQR